MLVKEICENTKIQANTFAGVGTEVKNKVLLQPHMQLQKKREENGSDIYINMQPFPGLYRISTGVFVRKNKPDERGTDAGRWQGNQCFHSIA